MVIGTYKDVIYEFLVINDQTLASNLFGHGIAMLQESKIIIYKYIQELKKKIVIILVNQGVHGISGRVSH